MADPAPASMQTIRRFLAGTYPCAGGMVGVSTKSVIIEPGLHGKEIDIVGAIGLRPPFAVVSDPETGQALGARVEAALTAAGQVIPVHLGHAPHADLQTAERVAHQTAPAGSVIAVGSGTINDLCKFAAARNGLPYAVFATAPSMNGYVSANAAITIAGHKKTLPAVAPLGIFMDLDVLSHAPVRMIRAGLGDSVCRATAEADWLLSHLLLRTPFLQAPFDFLKHEESALLADSAELVTGNRMAVSRLARTLVLSGMGMSVCQGSYPASQGEHLIGHYIEMMAPAGWLPALHGEIIGVTTLVMARLQERMLDGPPPVFRLSPVTRERIVAHFGDDIGPACWDGFAEKALDEVRADALNARLASEWPSIVGRLRQIILPATTLEAALRRAGAPLSYIDLGLEKDFFLGAVLHAREIRNRFTFLDLAADSGQLLPEDLI